MITALLLFTKFYEYVYTKYFRQYLGSMLDYNEPRDRHDAAVDHEKEMAELYNAMFKPGDSDDEEIDEETDDRDFVMTLACYAAISKRQKRKRLFTRRFEGVEG
ncbi:uncharacterized protein LOC111629441 [Centruroides sculpturatus]|uniref:uncharacterized protein LOC111629441 n=1 Tax=Centruroides sculpturatus TaxID=218467 RepID=UPI000C6CA0CF|nr:uncharacterized protein LOC111629441 [Centruroides sculpturatus]